MGPLVVGPTPFRSDQQIRPARGCIRRTSRDPPKQLRAYLAEKASDHHVEFLEHRLLFPAAQELVDDDGHQVHGDGKKTELGKDEHRYVVAVSEDSIMRQIENEGKQQGDNGNPAFPWEIFHASRFPFPFCSRR